MVSLTIDGKQVSVDKGTTIIKAAQKLGIHIPHFCYYPALSVAANCRICLVEVEKAPKLQTACSTPAAEGMVVHTNSQRVQKARQGVMEFLLINHPLDCPICDQAGECQLQDYSYTYGQVNCRFGEKKVHADKRSLGEHVLLHPSRCIKCTRCIRFCQELVGKDELTLIERSNHAEIATFDDQPLSNDYSANVVDLCPVGALTLKEFRFKERVWLLNQAESICPGCSKGCNVLLGAVGDKIRRIKPRANPAVNGYWICDYGRFNYNWVNEPGRLRNPLVKSNGRFLPVSWKEALDLVAENLRWLVEEEGPQSVAGVASSQLACEDAFLFVRLFHEVLGAGPVRFLPPAGRSADSRLSADSLLKEADHTPNYQGAVDMGMVADNDGLPGGVQGLYVAGADLIKLSQASDYLSGLKFLVVQELRMTASALLAQVVLPAASFAEKEGTFTNSAGRVQMIRPVMSPVGDARADWEIFAQIAKRLGRDFGFGAAGEVFEEISRITAGYKGMDYQTLGSLGQNKC